MGNRHKGRVHQESPTQEEAAAETTPATAEPTTETPTRRRRTREELEQVEISPDLLANPNRMNYVLLLALLAKQNGEVNLTQKELDVDEGAYNIFFAKTLKGDKINVSVVSAQSSILKAPGTEREAALWGRERQEFQPLPEVPPGTMIELSDGTKGRVYPMDTPKEDLLAAASPSLSPQERYLQQGAAEKEKMQMPFETGNSPGDTKPFDLGALTRESQRSLEIAGQEQEAAARVEERGY